MLGCMAEESNLGITAAASLGAATKNITRADLDATFSLTDLPLKAVCMYRIQRVLYYRKNLDLVLSDLKINGGVNNVSGFIIYENTSAGGCIKTEKLR